MRVLLSLDSSECSSDALQSIANQKWPDGTTIKVVTVVEPFDPDGVDSNSSFVSSLREKRNQDAQTLLNEAVEILKANCDAQIESAKKEDYKTDKAIIDLAKEWSADLIAVGSRNRTGIERMFLGSVSNAVLLKAPCSVAVIKPEPELSSDKTNVLIAIDGSSYSKAVIESASKRAWSKNVNFKLISAVEPELQNIQIPNPVAVLGELEDSKYLESKMQKYLGEEAGKLLKANDGATVEVSVIKGDPRELILNEIESWPAHYVFMGSRGNTGLKKLLLGSVSQAVATYSKCSIEIVR